MKMRLLTVLLFVLTFSAGCAGQRPTQQGTMMFSSFGDFKAGPKGGVDLVWSTKEIHDLESLRTTFQKYDSLILDKPVIVVDKESPNNLSDEQLEEIFGHLINELKVNLGQIFRLVENPAKTTLRLNIALTNIESPNPLLAVTSSLVPVGVIISTMSKITTGEHTNVGSARIELLVSDATSNKPLIAAIDRRTGNKDFGTMIDPMDDAKDAIRWWVRRLVTTLTSTKNHKAAHSQAIEH